MPSEKKYMSSEKKIKVAVVTGTRAEYRLLRLLLLRLQADDDIELQLVVTGSHLLPKFGDTWREIEADGIAITQKIAIVADGEELDQLAVTRAVACGIEQYSEFLQRHCPTVLVLLGDRYEILAAAQAALLLNIPIAHIHGGEVTHGAVDDSMRHAITKLSTLHFVATDNYRRRVIQLGESPDRVVNVGTLGLEGLAEYHYLSKTQLQTELGFSIPEPALLITYHPETLSTQSPLRQVTNLLDALTQLPDVFCLFTAPNIDVGGDDIFGAIDNFVTQHSNRCQFVASLGQRYYFSVLRCVQAVVGNSSSGIIEAPAFNIPTVNIGRRQAGRDRASSVIDVDCDSEAIAEGIKKALLQSPLSSVQHPYQNQSTYSAPSETIVDHLKTFDFDNSLTKVFYDLPVPPTKTTHNPKWRVGAA